jgi:hypothetical protein
MHILVIKCNEYPVMFPIVLKFFLGAYQIYN